MRETCHQLCFLTVATGAVLAGCVDPDCRDEFVGGGTYSITLSGDLRATIGGDGSTKKEIKAWIDDGNWADTVARYQASGETIAMLGRPLGEHPGYPGFISSQTIPSGTIQGCESATFIATFVSEDERRIELLNEDGETVAKVSARGPQPWDWASYDSPSGGEEFDDQLRVYCAPANGDIQSVTASVTWDLDERRTVRRQADCDSLPYIGVRDPEEI